MFLGGRRRGLTRNKRSTGAPSKTAATTTRTLCRFSFDPRTSKRYNTQPFQKTLISQYKKTPLRTLTTIARFQSQFSKHLTKRVERGRNTFVSSNRNTYRQNSISSKNGGKINAKRNDEKEKLSKQLSSLIKIAGIPILMYSVHQVGYHQGIIEYSKDPEEMRNRVMCSILSNFGTAGVFNIQVQTGDKMVDVPKKVINTAKSYVLTELNKCIRNHIIEELGPDDVRVTNQMIVDRLHSIMSPKNAKWNENVIARDPISQIVQKMRQDEIFRHWRDANDRMGSGHSSWKMIMIESDVPKAFVSELFPHTFFITTAMIGGFVSNADEFAFLIGHEISHVILGHDSDQNVLHTLLSAIEIMLHSLDPTGGFVSLKIIAPFIRTIQSSINASNSRANEDEADALGLKLAAMSCCDTNRAAKILLKIAQYEEEILFHVKKSGSIFAKISNSFININSHEPTMKRYKNLKELSKQENSSAYEERLGYCGVVQRSFWSSMRRK